MSICKNTKPDINSKGSAILLAALFFACALPVEIAAYDGAGWAESQVFIIDLRPGYARSAGNPGFGEAESGVFVIDLRGMAVGGQGAESGVFRLDLRGLSGGLAVIGKVYDSQTGFPLGNVQVQLGSRSGATSGDGSFIFDNVSLAAGSTLRLDRAGYAPHIQSLRVAPGSLQVIVSAVYLKPMPPAGVPVITRVESDYNGLFLANAPLVNNYRASVNWNGATPGSVEFYANDQMIGTASGAGPEYSALVNVVDWFGPSFRVGANTLRVIAVDSQGKRSEPVEQAVQVIPLPTFLSSKIGEQDAYQFIPGNNPIFSFQTRFPDETIPVESVGSIPFLGKFGWRLAVGVGFEYALNSGEWLVHAGLEPYGRFKKGRSGERPHSSLDNPKFFAGNREIEFGARLQAEGTATQARGIVLEQAGVVVFVDFEQELLAFYLSDYVPGAQWLRILDGLKRVGVDINSIQRVTVYGLLNGEFKLMAEFQPPPVHFGGADLLIGLGAKAAYEPDLKVAKGQIHVGGKIEGEFKIQPPRYGLSMQKISGMVFGGVMVKVWTWKAIDEEFVLVKGVLWQNPNVGKASIVAGHFATGAAEADQWIWLPIRSKPPSPISRDYLESGMEQFVAYEPTPRLLSIDGAEMTPLEAFRAMARRGPRAGVVRKQSINGGAGNGFPVLAQAELPMAENVFPDSSPALAGQGQALMLLYVSDSGLEDDLQFTDIKWTRFDGANWTVPAPIAADPRAEFAPQVRFDGNSDALAVWQRVAETNLSGLDMTAMAAAMEIVWSRWDHQTGAWSEPQSITANGYLDHIPLMCGPMSNGDLLLVWTKNEANQLMGVEDGSGAEAGSVMWTRWNAATKAWDTPQALIDHLPYVLSQSLAGAGARAVYAWSQDLDGVITNATDQQVYYCEWNDGAWAQMEQLTSDQSQNRNVRVAVSSDGEPFIVWQKGTNLVMSRGFSESATLVRKGSHTTGFADYAISFGPEGNLVLIWQEMSQDGSDAHYIVYDPVSETWSKDSRLCMDPPLERSFAPVWDDAGNLAVAYNKVEIVITNKIVTLEDGGTITVTNAPQSGRVDLAVLKRALIKDLSIEPGDFIVKGNNYLPGDPVELSAVVRNAGDIAVSNVVVTFYDGRPDDGGTLITNITITSWLEGATNALVSTTWIVPDPMQPHSLYAVVDLEATVSEFNETNNTQTVNIGGTDLAVSVVLWTAETNGVVRVIAQVQNLGAPAATNSVLAIYGAGETNVPLATADVPLLEPGRLAQLALDLPPGTQNEGEGFYQLFADIDQVTGDVDLSNNMAAFSVNLWIDSDNDGMPDGWERAYGLDPNNPADAALDSDGDQASNLAEYRSGTDPLDSRSYLRINYIGLDVPDGMTSSVQIAWGSMPNRFYELQRSSDLGADFSPIARHILATPPENSYLDTSVTNTGQCFYRIKVE